MDIEKITPENYNVPKGEERSYHCKIEVASFDQKTGQKVSKPRIQIFGQKMFEAFIYSSLKKQGYTVTILHDPKEWLKNQKAVAEKAAAEKEAARKAAEEKRFQEAVAAEVARQMAANNNETKKGGRPAKK